MGCVSRELVTGIVVTFSLGLALPVVAANWFVGFQTWLGNVMSSGLSIPKLLSSHHRPIRLGRRHVLLAFAGNSLFLVGLFLPILIWHDLWNLIPWLVVLSMAIGGNGALGRLRNLRHQRIQHQKDN